MTQPSDAAIAQAFRELQEATRKHYPHSGKRQAVEDIECRARELGATYQSATDSAGIGRSELDAAKGGACERCGKTRAGEWTAGHPLAFCTCAQLSNTPPAQAAEAVPMPDAETIAKYYGEPLFVHTGFGAAEAVDAAIMARAKPWGGPADASERVARAIAAEELRSGKIEWDELMDSECDEYRRMARAAIAAIDSARGG